MKIIRNPNGSARHEVDVNDIVVPDLWHVAMWLRRQGETEASAEVLETWHLCHDLLNVLKESNHCSVDGCENPTDSELCNYHSELLGEDR